MGGWAENMSPGCDVCGCRGGCPNGNMLNGWGAALCSILADFVTSTTAGIDGCWLGTTGFCHCSTSAAAVLHTLLRVLRWPALHWPPTAVELRSRRRWSCGAAPAAAWWQWPPLWGQRPATDRVVARPGPPHRPGRLGAPQWVVEVAKRHRSPPGAAILRRGCLRPVVVVGLRGRTWVSPAV